MRRPRGLKFKPGRLSRRATRRSLGRRRGEAATPMTITALEARTRTSGVPERNGSRIGFRLSMSAVVVAGLFCVLLVRLWSLQVIDGPQLNDLARETTSRLVEVTPPRGEIFARSDAPGDELAGSKPEWLITADRAQAVAHPAVVADLAALLGETPADIEADLNDDEYSPYAPVPLTPEGASPQAVLYVEEHGNELPGVGVDETYLRTYPEGALAAQTIGYVGDINSAELKALAPDGYTAQDQIGQTGLEAQYETELRGQPGIEEIGVDPVGSEVSKIETKAPVPGDDLYLNMDLGLEETTANALSSQVAALRSGQVGGGSVPADFAAAVVLNAQNGAVLAMSSYPSYDDNDWIPYITTNTYDGLLGAYGHPLNNWPVAGPGQAPGSTFKLVTATAALNDGLITPGYVYDDTGSYQISPTQVLHDSDNEALGPVNVVSALSESSDVFFYNLGAMFYEDQRRYGETPIQHVAADYGLGENSGIDLPDAASGQVDGPGLRVSEHAEDPSVFPYTSYTEGDAIETAFGQGETLVTPLQLAEAYATFANGGTRYAPELAAALVDQATGQVTRVGPKVLGHVSYGPDTYAPILEGLEGTVQSPRGTAAAAFSGFDFSSWNVAGKTGTATASNEVQPTSWFVAFGGPRGAPAKYVVAVEVYEGGYGAAASAPVARQIFDYLQSDGVAPLQIPRPPRRH